MSKLFFILLLSISTWAASIGSIMVAKGDVQVKRMEELLKATNGMELLKKDEIITESKARVQIMLKDSTVVTVGPNSSFSFEEFMFDESGDSKLEMKANRGFFRSVTGKIGKVAPERFKVKTASATIGIRGTDFSGEISIDKEVLKCYSGGISVAFEGGLKDIDAGMMMEISPKKIEIKQISQSKEKDSASTSKATKKKQTKEKDSSSDKKTDDSSNDKTSDDSGEKTDDNSKLESSAIIEPSMHEEIVQEESQSIEVQVEEVLDVAEVTMETVVEEAIIEATEPIIDIVEPFEMTPGVEDRQKVY